MDPIMECCCGVDVHKDMIEACIIDGFENPQLIQEQFKTNPSELPCIACWAAQ